MKKLILVAVATLAFVLALGSMGAYATETIGFGQAILQIGIAVIVEWLTLSHIND
jgi:hypothetical protein